MKELVRPQRGIFCECNQAMDHLDMVSERGGGDVAAAHREMIISGLTLSPLRKGSKEAKHP